MTLCCAQVWEVVKATFSSLDSAAHQLVSHYLRTHACTEPYIVATERCLATMHPLYQFLRPHYEHTLRMNAHVRLLREAPRLTDFTFSAHVDGKAVHEQTPNATLRASVASLSPFAARALCVILRPPLPSLGHASGLNHINAVIASPLCHAAARQARTTLVNAGGLLERTFTAGRFAMLLCAEAYKDWRFMDEALPADLIKRYAAPHGHHTEARWSPQSAWSVSV